nr:putative isomerase [Quercus suber]
MKPVKYTMWWTRSLTQLSSSGNRVQHPHHVLLDSPHSVQLTQSSVKICGHATLAAAHTLFASSLLNCDVIEFVTKSGTLTARKVADIQTINGSNIQNHESHESFLIELDFPTIPMIDFNSAEFSPISKALNGAFVIDIKRTATEDDLIDHVCGSVNCALALYWSKRLGKCDLVAYAASTRSGVVNIHLDEQNQRVLLRGKAVTIMEGSLSV